MNHAIVYSAVDHFAGWPANNGLWAWDGGSEILVGFTRGGFKEQPGHNIERPYRSLLARSLDGGQSWTTEYPANFVGSRGAVRPRSTPLALNDPNLALRLVGTGYHGSERPEGCFYASRDRGRTWTGPFALTGLAEDDRLAGKELTPRTAYLIDGPHKGLFFLSTRKPGDWADETVFCAHSDDGGQTFRFESWIVPPSDPYRAVMPSVVRCGPARLAAAIRRREIGTARCWIDAYTSADNGASWSFLSRVTETGPENGNPPALAQLADGRLCCVYGHRERRQIEARYSADQGRSWGEAVVLRADFQADAHGDADLGYPRLLQRADGALVACYYWATAARPRQHIAATIWQP